MWKFKAVFVIVVVFVTSEISGQNGSPCITPNGESATCRSIYDCSKLLNVVRSSNSNQLRFLRESQCGYANNPLVCCGSLDNYGTVSTSTVRSVGQTTRRRNNQNQQLSNRNIPDRTTCGFQESDRIYNGEDTDMDEFPWMSLLQYQNSSGFKRWSCGATLISPKYVLTAAHCVVGPIVQKVGRLSAVRLGEWNTETDVDCNEGGGIRVCNEAPVDIEVESALAHEGYNPNDDNRYNDIALVRLKRAVKYTNYIRPICLPRSNEGSTLGESLIVSGWGRTERLARSPIKQKLRIPIADKSVCTKTFATAGVRLRDDQICAGGEAGKDSCTGDSGGPLMRTSASDNTQWLIEGIVSFGARCGTEGWPGIYTKVNAYLGWIYQNVRN